MEKRGLKQKVSSFNEVYSYFTKYVDQESYTELELAGLIKLNQVLFDISWNIFLIELELGQEYAHSPLLVLKDAEKAGYIEYDVWGDLLKICNASKSMFETKLYKEYIIKIKTTFYELYKDVHSKVNK